MSHLTVVEKTAKPPLDLWIETVSGARIDFLNPNPKLIKINDIAWSLSRQARFAGHTGDAFPLSVAVHSIWMSMYMYKRTDCYSMGLYGLLQSASNAFMGEIPRGLRQIPSLRLELDLIEQRLQAAVYAALDMLPPNTATLELIAEAEEQALVQEARFHMRSGAVRWQHLPDPTVAAACVGFSLAQSPQHACEQYLLAYRIFSAKLKNLH